MYNLYLTHLLEREHTKSDEEETKKKFDSLAYAN